MPLTRDDRAFLQDAHRKLADKPLEPASPFYEPIHESLVDVDPVWLMQRQIELDEIQSLQLFSGFRGAGKTTELLRLKQNLELQGYFVLYADALDYVNPAEPIDISDLLMVLAGSFSDALERNLGASIVAEPFWKRLHSYLAGLEVTLTEVALKGELAAPAKEVLGGIKAGIDVKAQIKTGSSFRMSLQRFMATRIGEMKAQVDHFFEDGVKAIQTKTGEDTRVVFIFDQLEQLRGTYQTWQEVIRSVEQLFSIHIERLRIPYVHAVYAVPAWLKFLLPPEAPLTILPTVHLWNNDAARSEFEPGWRAFRSLVRRRLDSKGITRLFGENGAAARGPVDRLIEACGGHVRDLLRLLQETVKRATALPVTTRVVDNVINAARRDFLPIATEDAQWLREIGQRRDTALRRVDERSVERLSNFLDTHRVIYFVNDAAWYDIHPLIREEVDKVVAAGQAKNGA